MSKVTFLTRRWNNILSIGLGIPLTFFIGTVVLNSGYGKFSNFLGVVIFGVVY